MRKLILVTLLGILAAIVLARARLPEPGTAVFAPADRGYNLLDLRFPGGTETAGSGQAGELSSYFQSLAPTEKHAFSGALAGKSLLLVCADDWAPDPDDALRNPTLARLARQSVPLGDVWRPEWYQGAEGRLFARLTGLVPTRADDRSALVYAAAQKVALPFSLPSAFVRAGYDCRAFGGPDSLPVEELTALGFASVEPADALTDALQAAQTPVFFYVQWSGNGEVALAELWRVLGGERRADTALCLLTSDADPERAQLYLWGAGLTGASGDAPCSELDLTPTLLDLFGLAYDSRLLSGRDILASDDGTALVTLRGSAFSDWVTARGRCASATGIFTGDPPDGMDAETYIGQMALRIYRRYIYARRALECDWFRLLMNENGAGD